LVDLENNIWLKLASSTHATLGITSVHSALAGKLSKVKFKPVGSNLKRNQSLASIESVRYYGVVRTPIDCKLVQVNSRLESDPKFANDSPYDLGWFAEIEWNVIDEPVKLLVSPKDAVNEIRDQIHTLRVRCFSAYPDHEMWEIGVECAAVIVRLNELLDRAKVNEVVHVVSDDPTADIEMERWAMDTGQVILETRKEGKLAHFIVKKVK
jgi:glycine cleavage system H lipoate-binding protein/TusA-related sulfurtransferase